MTRQRPASPQGRSSLAKRKRERRRNIQVILLCVFCAFLACLSIFLILQAARRKESEKIAALHETESDNIQEWEGAPPIDVELLTVNPYSRPGIAITAVNGIVIHYTANPGATAIDNRNYFENLKDTQDNKVSSHFVVGIEGEVVQCIPSSEISYASNSRNSDTLSIECCHVDETGAFTDATYTSVVNLTAWLCKRFNVGVENVIRHYDVTGKNCPKYYVEHPEAWTKMKEDIQARMTALDQGET